MLRQYLAGRSLWLDESLLALNVLHRSWGGLLGTLEYNQAAPWGVLLLLKGAVTVFGSNEYALRAVPLLSALAAIAVFLHLSRRVLDPPVAALATALFACSETIAYYGSEVKPYATDLLAATVLLLVAHRVLPGRAPPASAPLVAAALGALAVWFSFPSVLLLSAFAFVWLGTVARPGTAPAARRTAIIACAAWGISFACAYFLVIRALSTDASRLRFWEGAFPPALFSPAALAWLGGTLHSAFLDPLRLHPFWLAAPLFLLGCFQPRPKEELFTAVLSLSVCAALLAAVLGKYPFQGRLIVFFLPVFVLLVCQGVGRFARARCGTLPAAVIAAALLAIPLRDASTRVLSPLLREELRTVLEEMRSVRRSDELLYVYYGAAEPFRYYAPRFGIRSEAYHLGRRSREDPRGYEPDIAIIASGGRRWILFSHVYGSEEAFFLSKLDVLGQRLREIRAFGSSAHLYTFPVQAHVAALQRRPSSVR